ncbi:MAG: UDP-N-acetylglucosamine diphosphorylase/glucosamine-1-phosphate N-acetyltransferase [Patiriisocius sp.]|jgi:UDP-N-acetylglucosamine diphosphorylase/glucosamine-1-phosphate N-acetyltransferase
MVKVVLFDRQETRIQFLPLTYTRAISDMRFGMMTIIEKWRKAGFEVLVDTAEYLQHDLQITDDKINEALIFIDATTCPSDSLLVSLNNLASSESIKVNNNVLAFNGTYSDLKNEQYLMFKSSDVALDSVLMLNKISDLFAKNHIAIEQDYEVLTNSQSSSAIDKTCTLLGDKLFLEEGVTAHCAIFNTLDGPIFIDKNAQIMEGSMLRGPLYVGENSVVKMGAKIYGATTIGPHCKVGGEVGNSILFGYSNKGHDGYLGNSILGEWCNLGADTNTSNLKNNYGPIKTWSYKSDALENTGLTFHGLIMGDHSKSSINTMFNTGTVVGVCSNIYGGGFPKKFIPSFSWGGKDGWVDHDPNKAISTAKAVYARRKKDLHPQDESILRHIFNISGKYRT